MLIFHSKINFSSFNFPPMRGLNDFSLQRILYVCRIDEKIMSILAYINTTHASETIPSWILSKLQKYILDKQELLRPSDRVFSYSTCSSCTLVMHFSLDFWHTRSNENTEGWCLVSVCTHTHMAQSTCSYIHSRHVLGSQMINFKKFIYVFPLARMHIAQSSSKID